MHTSSVMNNAKVIRTMRARGNTRFRDDTGDKPSCHFTAFGELKD